MLDLEQKSSADEREAYKGTLSEETAIQKEHKKEEICRISTSKKTQSKKTERRNRIFNGILALFGLCLNEAAPFVDFSFFNGFPVKARGLRCHRGRLS